MIAMRTAFYGWRVVGAAFIIAMFAWGAGFYGPPIFLQALHAVYGWPVSVISAAITAHFLLGAAIVANLGTLHRRFGVAAVTRAGAILAALGLLGWGFARQPWQLFLATPFSGAGWAMTSGAALNAMVAPWFIRRRAAALGMAFNGASMGGVVFSPLWVALIARFGFPVAAMLVAAAIAASLWFLAGRYLTTHPAAMGLAPDGDVPTAPPSATPQRASAGSRPLENPWRDRRFVTLAASATLGLFAQIGLVDHLFSLLAPRLGDTGAGATMAEATACAILGRILLARLVPANTDRRMVAAANVAMQALGSVALLCAGPSLPLILFGCALFGLGLGNVTSLPPLIAQAEFTAADLARVVALVTAISQAGYAFAPAAFGLLRGVGTAPPSAALFAAAALIQLAAAAAILLGRERVPGARQALAGLAD